MHERRRHSRWLRAVHYSGALGLLLCLGFVSVKAQQTDFTGVWTNYVEPGGRAGGAGRRRGDFGGVYHRAAGRSGALVRCLAELHPALQAERFSG